MDGMTFMIFVLMMKSFLNYFEKFIVMVIMTQMLLLPVMMSIEHVKLHAHKGINSYNHACAVEHSVIKDVTLASVDKYAEPQAHKVISRLAAHS